MALQTTNFSLHALDLYQTAVANGYPVSLVGAMAKNPFWNSIPIKYGPSENLIEKVIEYTEGIPNSGRAYNSDFSVGSTNSDESIFTMGVFGNKLKIDSVLARNNPMHEQEQLTMGTTGAINDLTKAFFKGVSLTDSNNNSVAIIKGITDINTENQTKIKTGQDNVKVQAGGVQTGYQINSDDAKDRLLSDLDLCISNLDSDMIEGTSALCMGKDMMLLFKNAVMTRTLGGTIDYIQFLDRSIPSYSGFRILEIGKDSGRNEILGFDETSPDGTTASDCGSIWVIRFGQMKGVYFRISEIPAYYSVQNASNLEYVLEVACCPVVKGRWTAIRLEGIRRA